MISDIINKQTTTEKKLTLSSGKECEKRNCFPLNTLDSFPSLTFRVLEYCSIFCWVFLYLSFMEGMLCWADLAVSSRKLSQFTLTSGILCLLFSNNILDPVFMLPSDWSAGMLDATVELFPWFIMPTTAPLFKQAESIQIEHTTKHTKKPC